MVQVPVPNRVTEVPDTVQTADVSEAKLTVRPELAVALSGTGPEVIKTFDSAAKLIVWFACDTVTVPDT